MVWVASRALYEKHGQDNDIYNYPFIGYPASEVYYKHLKSKVDFSRLRHFLTFSDSESVLLAVHQDHGVALTPRIKVERDLANGSLIEFPSKYSGSMPISVLYDYELDFTLSSKRFVTLLKESQEKIIQPELLPYDKKKFEIGGITKKVL